MGRRDPTSPVSLMERQRNRSLCATLYTPPPYPGYAAMMSSTENKYSTNQTYGLAVVDATKRPTISLNNNQNFQSNKGMRQFHLMSSTDSSSTINNIGHYTMSSSGTTTVSKDSSGYGSSSSVSGQEIDQLLVKPMIENKAVNSFKIPCQTDRIGDPRGRYQMDGQERHRRKSVPAYLRDTFSDEIFRILDKNQANSFENGVMKNSRISSTATTITAANRPATVLQLARKFAEASAAQDKKRFATNHEAKEIDKSSSGSSTLRKHRSPSAFETISKTPGGIAFLSLSQVSKREGAFKQSHQLNHHPREMQANKTFNPASIKDALLRWCQIKLKNYPVTVSNFSSSWADGMAFCALIHRFAPDSFDFSKLNPQNRRGNFELAFKVAELHGVIPLLEVDDMLMMGDRPDWKCVFTYVQTFYKEFKDRP